MAIWQDTTTGFLHDDESGAALALASWPQGLAGPLTDAQIAAARAPTLAAAQAAQIAIIDTSYAEAVQVSVSFKNAAGVTQAYQADNDGPLSSQSVLLKNFTGYNIAGTTPTGFYWQAEDNTQVPFTLADLGDLYGTMLAQGNAAFNQREKLKAAIRAATTVAAVQAITWPEGS
jgi:hypothetical protein